MLDNTNDENAERASSDAATLGSTPHLRMLSPQVVG
jgi:hypothetical protein